MLKISNLSFEYQKHHPLLKNISLQIPQGFFSLLSGPSGCGKSTLLKLLSSLYPKFGGKITHGKIENNFKTWSMMFQDPDKQFTMETPYQELIFALENLNLPSTQARDQIDFAIQETKIQNLLHQKFITLSGGEKQRVALAIIIAMDSDLILLDEPFASCDPNNRQFLLKKLVSLKNKGKTIVITDHDPSGYQNICDQLFIFDHYNITCLKNKELQTYFKSKKSPDILTFQLPKDGEEIFSFDNFSLKIGDKVLINNQTIKIYPHHATLLTGNNGAGKSSIFKVLTKMTSYAGSVTYQGKEIQKIKRRKYLQKVAQAFQNPDDQFLMVAVSEELELGKKINTFLSEKDIQHLLHLLNLDSTLEQVVYSLSGGQKKKLQLLLMLLAYPDVLLLDEPFAGLDKQSIYQVSRMFKDYYLNQGKTLIIISHQSTGIKELCDYHLLLKNHQLNYTEGGLTNES